MQTIDYIYRFDPKNPSVKQHPPDADSARRTLEDGNRMFSKWMESCRTSTLTKGSEPQYVVPCNGLEVGMNRVQGDIPKAAPFAVVVGCSDARVPTEMIFGQGFNDLFVIRVAGNVLGDECIGSVDYALNVLSDSVKLIIVLGHSGCGAVTAAVDAYLKPLSFWSKSRSNNLRSILQRILFAVREAANGLSTAWGPDAPSMPGYRDALIETAVCVNTAQAAYDLHVEVERAGKWEIEVYYGVYNLFTHQVSMPNENPMGMTEGGAHLEVAPTNPREFTTVAARVAKRLLENRQAAKAASVAIMANGPATRIEKDEKVEPVPSH
ncbi:MAG: carbonic anhydrase [Actinomycetota bacterium]|nr:carbonic anhydrase [Actinomycetota bacterium]